jgi:ubiquinone/menaquinone biosynthesis C-methylase UbiE
MNEYFEGKRLIGNDYSFEQIKKWYDEEAEGYANLGSKDIKTYFYGYHMMNKIHGFDKIKGLTFNNVLGMGSAWGYEFEPIIKRISNLTIIEPSDNMVSNKIGDLTPTYVKPNVDGHLSLPDNSFDLITSFGTLHHIPNVSFVMQEIIRVLKPGGHLLMREPIVSMGDWRKPRTGLTKNERGIPLSFFESEFNKYPVEVVSREHCFTMTAFLQRNLSWLFKKPIYSYKAYVLADKFISNLLKNNVRYHPTRKINKVAPVSIFYVVKKSQL